MTMIAALLVGLAVASPDEPENVPEMDISAFADELVVLSDGDGHMVAFDQSKPRENVWYGDGKHFYLLQVFSSGANGEESWSVGARDFRASNRQTMVGMRDGQHWMSCADVKRDIEPLSDAESRKIVKNATFHEHRWRRNAVGAYRDEWGVYYFIDRATGDDEDADHRVYIGWQGQILRAPLKLLASDSLGRVYSAGNGTRRLVITKDEARYIENDERRVLHALDLRMDGPYIYTDLGVYGDAVHGTPCDALLGQEP